jgi:hypothetical protein
VTTSEAILQVLEADPGPAASQETIISWLTRSHAVLCQAAGEPVMPEGILRAKWDHCPLGVVALVREGIVAGLRAQLSQHLRAARWDLIEGVPWDESARAWYQRSQAILQAPVTSGRATA